MYSPAPIRIKLPEPYLFGKWVATLSPEQDKLFLLLCVFSMTVSDMDYNTGSDKLFLALYRIHVTAAQALHAAGSDGRVSLRVRTAMERIADVSRNTIIQLDVHKSRLAVAEAAAFGTEKPKLLNTVSNKTWREQCAGRARLAMKRDDTLLARFNH